MKKVLAVMIASLFAAGAYAQNPAGASSQEQVITNSKSQEKAQSKVDARPQGKVKKPVGDQAASAQNDAIGTGKAAAVKQGGTPDMPGAK